VVSVEEVQVSARRKEPLYRLSDGQAVVVTARTSVTRPAIADGVLQTRDGEAPKWLSHRRVEELRSQIAANGLVSTWLARTTGAELDLVRVVSLVIPGGGIYDGMGYSPDLLTDIEDAARSYLAGVAERLKGKVTVRTELLLGAAADQLLAHMTDTPAELVVLASHGRSGVIRTALGSVADRMLHGPAPALILRPEQAQSRFVEAARSAVEAPSSAVATRSAVEAQEDQCQGEEEEAAI
jgi:nucleotide-binding universal stress UspA family protein